ncbi:unnamed protein product [Zymoseptoria tritici ST99CH_3D1]|nr:unnamed protein product [Zymoseptoria tritici ST99CH_3D1]
MDSSSVQRTMASPNEEQLTARLLQLVKSLPVELQIQIVNDIMPTTLNIVVEAQTSNKKIHYRNTRQVNIVLALVEALPELASSFADPSNVKLPAITNCISLRFQSIDDTESGGAIPGYIISKYARLEVVIPLAYSISTNRPRVADVHLTFTRTSTGSWTLHAAASPIRDQPSAMIQNTASSAFTAALGSSFINDIDPWAIWMLRDHISWLVELGAVKSSFRAVAFLTGWELRSFQEAVRLRRASRKTAMELGGLLLELRGGLVEMHAALMAL